MPSELSTGRKADNGKSRAELLSILRDQSGEIGRRATALGILTRWGAPGRLEPLLIALEDVDLCRHSSGFAIAARSLAVAERRNLLPLDEREAFLTARHRLCDRLLSLLDEDGESSGTENALAEYGDERFLPWCNRKLGSPDPKVRTRVVHLLARMRTDHSKRILEVVFETDANDRVRSVAAIMLAMNGNPIAQELLVRYPTWDLWILAALCRLGHPRAIVELRSRMLEDDENPIVRNVLADCLLPQITGVEDWRPIVVAWADEWLSSFQAS